MTFEEFDKLQEGLFNDIKIIGQSKGKEYANAGQANNDRLNNFKESAKKHGTTPQKILYIFMDKHIKSIENYIFKGEVPSEGLKGKILDVMNYASLLYALYRDSIEPNDSEVLEYQRKATLEAKKQDFLNKIRQEISHKENELLRKGKKEFLHEEDTK